MAQIRKEVEVEEKIIAAARRMAELPSGNRRERHKRKQSLQQSVYNCLGSFRTWGMCNMLIGMCNVISLYVA